MPAFIVGGTSNALKRQKFVIALSLQTLVNLVRFCNWVSASGIRSGPALADAGPNARPRRGAQCKTLVGSPMQDLGAGPLRAVIL